MPSLATPKSTINLWSLPSISQFVSAASRRGFDIVQPFHSKWYNDQLEKEDIAHLRRLPSGKALLIGNTKHFWPIFLSWLRKQDYIPPDPIDSYTKNVLSGLVEEYLNHHSECRSTNTIQIFWSHDSDTSSMVSMSRVASVSGLCYTHPSAMLSIHPQYGVWLSLRAVVIIVDVDHTASPFCDPAATVGKAAAAAAAAPSPPPLLSNPLTKEQDEMVQKAAQIAFSQASDIGWSNTMEKVDPWIRLRDSVAVGKEFRFADDQLRYHYLQDKSILEKALKW